MTQRYASKSALSRRVTSPHVGHGQFGCASCARTAGVCVKVFRCTPVYKRNTAELLQPSHPRTAALSESGGEKASTVFICLGVSVTIEQAEFTSKTEPIGEPPKHRACFSYSGHHMHACMDAWTGQRDLKSSLHRCVFRFPSTPALCQNVSTQPAPGYVHQQLNPGHHTLPACTFHLEALQQAERPPTPRSS